MIPTESLIPKLNGQSVILYQNGKAIFKDVETGIRGEKEIQITSGINSGDTLVTTNILRLKPNNKVKIVNIN
ncbi:MAG: hypothetical protein IPL53_19690 [Ignavibacteria bacterium]|nr:hypothetical protein [Ignavibacteria bacterium]